MQRRVQDIDIWVIIKEFSSGVGVQVPVQMGKGSGRSPER